MSSSEKFSCGLCEGDKGDSQTVECVICKTQYHIKCVVVNDNMTSWRCDNCKSLSVPSAPKSQRSKSVRSRASSSTSQKLALKKLEEEERILQDSITEKVRIQKEFLQKKYEILQQEGSQYASTVSSRSKVQSWIDENVHITTSAPPKHSSTIYDITNSKTSIAGIPKPYVNTSHQSDNAVVVASNQDTTELSKADAVFTSCQSLSCTMAPMQQVKLTTTTSYKSPEHAPENAQTFLANGFRTTNTYTTPMVSSQINNSAAIQSVPIYQDEPIASSNAILDPIGHNSFTNATKGRTTINHHDISKPALAARQVVPKDLPTFSGKPSEWPEFIAAYEFTTDVCEISEYENAGRLYKYLTGIALESVKSSLYLPEGATQAIQTLRRLFGQPEFVINELLDELRKSEKPNAESLDSIIQFSLKVGSLCASMKKSSLIQHLSNPLLLQELINYLPTNLMYEWAQFKYRQQGVDLDVFSTWLRERTDALLCILQKAPLQSKVEKFKEHLNVHQTASIVCRVCGADCLSIDKCKQFIDAPLSRKWELVKGLSLCRTCLKPHRGTCKNKVKCGMNQCEYLHHKLLHNYSQNKTSLIQTEYRNQNTQSNPDDSVNLHRGPHQKTFFKIVPVTLSKNNKHINTYAILDDCSSLTLIEQSLSDSLGLTGQTFPLHIKWTNEISRTEEDSQLVCVEVTGSQSSKRFKMDRVRTVNRLNLPNQTQSLSDLQKYSHLTGIPLPSFENAVPQMLIGLPHAKLLSSSKVKVGKDGEPLAAKTPLGWVMYGTAAEGDSRVLHINEHSDDDLLGEEVKRYFSLESLGIALKHSDILSSEESRAKSIMESTTTFNGTSFETGLLWKYDSISLPSSYEMAKHRLTHLERKLNREPELSKLVHSLISEYLQKGYARIVSNEEITLQGNNCWYLPMFIVRNANKPSKVRLVWDAAAKARNVSLNSMLLKGPDTLLSLPGILRRFREKKVAFTGDIKEMFHQVLIRKEDQPYQRFLWRFQDDVVPSTLCMNVMTFGATCSPSCANYVLNLNASRFESSHPDAVKSIRSSHYVDDLLEGSDSVEGAIRLAKEIRSIHQKGGFEIRNWSSNDINFLTALNEGTSSQIDANVELHSDNKIEKILGLWWNTTNDSFTFLLKNNKSNDMVLNGSAVPSKRDILRTIMSIFDPLGFLSHILIYPRILLQEIWRSGLSWDEAVSEDVFSQWKLWVTNLKSIEQLRIPRFYEIEESTAIELHTYMDASEDAFSCAVYIRFIKDNRVRCVLVAAKSKVAPLKPLSMPRLELQAALIGARLAFNVKSDHTFRVKAEYYWSDSVTVLSWLRSDSRRYKQFVAVRVGEILELTSVTDWRWIPTKLNVADIATRKVVQDITSESPWFQGPSFMYESEENWPKHKYNSYEKEEIRAQYLTETINFHFEGIVAVEEHSNWRRVLRVQAFIFRFVHNCKVKCGFIKEDIRNGPLLRCEYISAQNILFKACQYDGYPDEMACLLHEPEISIPKSSPIYKDAPYLDNSGVMRANSRLSNAESIPRSVKNPIILPKKHKTTELLLNHYHKMYHHLNSETAVNELRQIYIIPTLRVLMKTISHKCQYCKNKRVKPHTPFMGNLPNARLGIVMRPFSFIGIDYFGPISVRVRRSNEKRWGVIITCLSVRAIHIEVARTLTTDSCMMCLQRFMCRRGTPLEIYSDNGKNFRGASKELQSALSAVNSYSLAEKFTSDTTQWFFNPPSAPHMGGAWERLVRSIKVTLSEILPTRTPTEELLNTMLHEVENIINSRPLTYVPLESDLEEAITPNHFLLGSSSGKKPMGHFSSNVWLLKNNWKKCEEYSTRIWRRWRQEYLPEIRKRPTFNEHHPNIKVGDIGILCDDNAPKNVWPKCIVIATYPSNDGRVRRVTIRTTTGTYDRPASKLAILDVRTKNSTSIEDTEVLGKTVEEAAPAPCSKQPLHH